MGGGGRVGGTRARPAHRRPPRMLGAALPLSPRRPPLGDVTSGEVGFPLTMVTLDASQLIQVQALDLNFPQT